MRHLKKFIFVIVIVAIGLISCSKVEITKTTPEEFIKNLFTETDKNKFVSFIQYRSEFYDENGNIKKDELNDIMKDSEEIRKYFQSVNINLLNFYPKDSIKVEGLDNEVEVVRVYDNSKRFDYDFYLYPKGKTYVLWFNSTIGINEINFLQYKVSDKTDVPTEFRVIAKLDDYYNYSFDESINTHYSFELTDAHGDYVNGYVLKNSEVGKKMYDLLKDGQEHKVIVKIHIPNNEDPTNDIFVIDDFISDSWVNPNQADKNYR